MDKNKDEIFNEDTFNAIITNRAVRQNVAYQSHLLFFHIFFPHYVKYPIAEFQKDIFRITEDASNKLACIVAFRGSGKSTLVTLSYSLWSVLGIQQKKFVLIICHTQAQARYHMASLKYELEHNRLLKSDLGPFREEIGSGEWAMSSVVFKNTGARIMVASVDQSVRGIRHRQDRPDLIILDDIEDMNSVRTYEGRTKIFDWFSREIIPLGDIGTRIIAVGNLLHEDSLMMQLKRRMDHKEINGVYRWFPLIDDKGKCLWPEKFDTKEKIEELRSSVISETAWLMEYLLINTSDKERIIWPEWLRYYKIMPEKNEKNEYRGAFIGGDLAISEKERADCTAMVTAHVFGYGEKMKIYIGPNPINERLDFSTSLETAKLLSTSLAHRNRNAQMYVENNGYQEAFIQMIEKDRRIPITGIPSRGDKRTRLALVSTAVKSGQVLFPIKGAEELISQLTGFGMERHDDLTDAFSIVVGEIIKNNHGRPGMIVWGRAPIKFGPGGERNFGISKDMKF